MTFVRTIQGKPVFRYTIIEPYLQYLKQGIKTAEGRVNSIGYSNLVPGVFIDFYSKLEEILCRVIYKHQYSSFKEMLNKEGLQNMLPNKKTIEEGEMVYARFPGANRVVKFGAIAIGVQRIAWRRLNMSDWIYFDKDKKPEIRTIEDELSRRAIDNRLNDERRDHEDRFDRVDLSRTSFPQDTKESSMVYHKRGQKRDREYDQRVEDDRRDLRRELTLSVKTPVPRRDPPTQDTKESSMVYHKRGQKRDREYDERVEGDQRAEDDRRDLRRELTLSVKTPVSRRDHEDRFDRGDLRRTPFSQDAKESSMVYHKRGQKRDREYDERVEDDQRDLRREPTLGVKPPVPRRDPLTEDAKVSSMVYHKDDQKRDREDDKRAEKD